MALFIVAPIASDVLLVAAGPEYAAGAAVLVGVAAVPVLSGAMTPLSAASRDVDQPKYVFYVTVKTLPVGVPAVVAVATAGGIEGVVLALVLLELGGVLASEVAAVFAFGSERFRTGAERTVREVAGTIRWRRPAG